MDLDISQLDGKYVDVVKHYGGTGAVLLQTAADAEDYLKKAEAVVEAAGSGAAFGAGIGAAIPVLGEAGITEVIGGYAGAYIAGVVAAFDEFGGDVEKIIHNVFNPDDFTPGDYDRQRKRCIASGGLPNPGWPPDNEMGCIYPTGGTSGGEWPRDPGPGRAVRGDNPYPQTMPPGMCPDANGNPIPCPTVRPTQAPPMFRTPTKPLDMVMINKAILAAMHVPGHAPAPAPMPKLPPAKPNLRAIGTQKIATTITASPSKIDSSALGAAHLVLTAMGAGDPTAKGFVKAASDGAKLGDTRAAVVADTLTAAAKLKTQAYYVDKYLIGPSPTAGGFTTGAVPACGGCKGACGGGC